MSTQMAKMFFDAFTDYVDGLQAGQAWKKLQAQMRFIPPETLEYEYPAGGPTKQLSYKELMDRSRNTVGWGLLALGVIGILFLIAGSKELGGAFCGLAFLGSALLQVGLWIHILTRPKDQSLGATSITRPLDLATARSYTISLPQGTEWDGVKAAQVTRQLLTKCGPLTFQIVATSEDITWQVLDLRSQAPPDLVRNTIHALYPSAQVDDGPIGEEGFASPFYRVIIPIAQAHQEDIAPLLPIRYVEDLAKFDPLVNITQEMSTLQHGERATFTLHVVGNAEYIYHQVPDVLTIPGAPKDMTEAGFKAAGGELPPQELVGDELARIIGKKLDNACGEALLWFQFDGDNPDRVLPMSSMVTHLRGFQNLPFNALIELPEDACRYVTVDSPEVAQATSALGLLDRWLTNQDTSWRRHRLVLDIHELASVWHLPNERFTAPNIAWTTGRQVQLPRAMWGKTEGVPLGQNRYAGRVEPVYMLDADRALHTAIIGRTGTGKSSYMQNLLNADIARGRGVAVVDPHGDLVSRILRYGIPEEREGDVVVLDVSNEVDGVHYPPPMNLLARPPGLEVDLAAGQRLNVIERIYGNFATTQMADTLFNALVILAAEPMPTVVDVERVFNDDDYRRRLVEQLDNLAVEQFWAHYESMKNPNSLTYPVLRRMRAFYRSRVLFPILCHPDPLPIKQLLADSRIILISLQADESKIPAVERLLLGAMMISQIQMAAMTGVIRKDNRPFYLYIDETQNFVTTSLDTVLSEARKYGLALVFANQYLKQLVGDTLDALMGNVGGMTIFELGEPDAKLMSSQLKPYFAAADLMNLGRFKAVVTMRCQGERMPPFSLETYKPPEAETEAEFQLALEREAYLRRLSVENYTPKSYDEVMDWLNQRYRPERRKKAEKPAPEEAKVDEELEEFVEPLETDEIEVSDDEVDFGALEDDVSDSLESEEAAGDDDDDFLDLASPLADDED